MFGSAGLRQVDHSCRGYNYTPKEVMSPGMPHPPRAPITVALVDDYDVVVKGVANMLEPYRDRSRRRGTRFQRVRQRRRSTSSCTTHSPNPSPITKRSDISSPTHVRIELWCTPGTFTLTLSRAHGNMVPTGICQRRCPRESWWRPWRPCMSGQVVVSDVAARARSAPGLDWPGRGEGLSEREAEILALITQGMSNADVARLTYLSPNTVKSYIRTIYRKLGVSQSHPGRLVGCQARVHARPPPHRALARRALAAVTANRQFLGRGRAGMYPLMGLSDYRRQRRSGRSPGQPQRRRAGDSGPQFVIQHHAARSDHYDFRLEIDGVLVSWAIPRGTSVNPQDRRMARRMKDHPIDDAEFEGHPRRCRQCHCLGPRHRTPTGRSTR